MRTAADIIKLVTDRFPETTAVEVGSAIIFDTRGSSEAQDFIDEFPLTLPFIVDAVFHDRGEHKTMVALKGGAL